LTNIPSAAVRVGHIPVVKFVTHSRTVLDIAARFGWLPGARYTNLRDIKNIDRLGFLDIDWRNYDFHRHAAAARSTRPFITIARDLERIAQLNQVLEEAAELSESATYVVIVPKAIRLGPIMAEAIPEKFLLGYSVPTRYGGTRISPIRFTRPVHLLGGRPDVQRKLATQMPVVSFDCNRFTLDAAFGDYFDGQRFRPHPVGGYKRCLADSLSNITELWRSYAAPIEIAGAEQTRSVA
jgi:hypothetical protein